jgi:hypothetical protein
MQSVQFVVDIFDFTVFLKQKKSNFLTCWCFFFSFLLAKTLTLHQDPPEQFDKYGDTNNNSNCLSFT